MTRAEFGVTPSSTEMEGAGTAVAGGEVTEDEIYSKEIRTVHGSHQPPHGSIVRLVSDSLAYWIPLTRGHVAH